MSHAHEAKQPGERPGVRQNLLTATARYNGLIALQRRAGNAAVAALVTELRVQRTTLGTKVTNPSGSRSPFKTATATFDGKDFVLSGDGKALISVEAQSGRPLTVRPRDRAACHGSPDDSYLNNPRYVGIADFGPIPEGDYSFTVQQMTTFSATEQAQMILGGSYTDPFGASLHGGDWGSGRVALQPRHILPSPFGGKTSTRSGFFLHGGSLPGSSGCIDVGNDAFDQVVKAPNTIFRWSI